MTDIELRSFPSAASLMKFIALVKRTSDHSNRLLPDTTFIISSVAYEDNESVIFLDQSHQLIRPSART